MHNFTVIQHIQTFAQQKEIAKIDATAQGGFKQVFQNAIADVVTTDQKVTQGVQQVVTGQTDDLTGLMADINKAQLSLSLLVQMRNKALDAYNEIMRINL